MGKTSRTARTEQPSLLVNGIYQRQRLTGVQRYAREVLRRLPLEHRVSSPPEGLPAPRVAHHLWEQMVLPLKVAGDSGLLWSPTGTGPVFLRRQVVTLHDASLLSHPEWFSRDFVIWRRLVIPLLARSVCFIITVSRFAAEHIRERLGIEHDRLRVVANGVDHNRFSPTAGERVSEVRRKYGLPESYVLAVGAIDPRKNLRRLLKAWGRLDAETRGHRVLALAGGKGENFNQVDFPVTPDVRFLGYVADEDLPALYAGAVALAFPSLFEGFGLPVLEAMAVGTPVLTSDASALPEVAGDAALLVEPEDVDAIAQGLSLLLRNEKLRQRLRVAGRKRARSFTWERTARETAAVLEEARSLLSDGRPPGVRREGAP